MSAKEVDRLEIIRRVLERRLKRVKAAQVLGITARQVRRLCDAYEREGAAALVSKRRGRPSNHRLSEEIQRRYVPRPELFRHRGHNCTHRGRPDPTTGQVFHFDGQAITVDCR